jgi:hypothetical protein
MRRLKRLAAIAGAVVIGLTALIVVLAVIPSTRTTLVTTALRFILWQRGFHLAGGDISLKRGLIVCSNILIEDDRH